VVFIEWWSVVRVFTIVLMITAGACGIWLVRKKRWPIRLPVRLLSSLLVLVGVLGALFFWVFPNPNSYSVPVYSPNRKFAARVYEYNASGFGGQIALWSFSRLMNSSLGLCFLESMAQSR
jgi:hypothetical protein